MESEVTSLKVPDGPVRCEGRLSLPAVTGILYTEYWCKLIDDKLLYYKDAQVRV